MGTSTRAWGIGLSLGVGMAAGACFNPPQDAGLTSAGLACAPGIDGCACTEQGTCNAGLSCVDGVCVGDVDPTGTGGATGIVTTSPEPPSDDTSTTAPPDETTLALDDTTGDATTGEASTGPGSSTGMPEPAMETVNFPTAADPRFFMFGTLPWNGGDYYEGVRDTIVPSVSQLDVHIPIVSNGLSECGFQEAAVILNGVWLGTFVVAQGTPVIDQSFLAPAVVGPQYTIRYETVATVASGCGAAGYAEVGSTVTLRE
jgi:hypothetical protein